MTSLRRFPEECRMKIGYIEYAELFDIVGKYLFPNDWNGEAEVRMGKEFNLLQVRYWTSRR